MGERGSPRSDDLVVAEKKQQVDRPPKYKVLLHNDNYTTMDFVVHVLVSIFHKSQPEAERIMLDVHTNGIGVAGVYGYEVAEMKVLQVTRLARQSEFPLLCTIEEE